MVDGHSLPRERMPEWMRRPLARPGQYVAVEGLLGKLRLNTVCQSAKCPNRGECFANGTATFLVMGSTCTRACRFCAVGDGHPQPLDGDEPRRVAEAVARLGLSHAVVTMVTRDDLPDGGASHMAAVIAAVRDGSPATSIEVLTSDFAGSLDAVDGVVDAHPDVFNHNVETVPRLYPQVRPGADYRRSLSVLAHAAQPRGSGAPDMPVKSGLMLGLGETAEEVVDVMRDLRESGVGLLTLGQYLRPGPDNLPVESFVEPHVFQELERQAESLGFDGVASAPYVRSSYAAGDLAVRARQVSPKAGGKAAK